MLGGSRGSQPGRQQAPPSEPHCLSGRSLGLSCGLLRILLTEDQPACAKPRVVTSSSSSPAPSHGPSCPGKTESQGGTPTWRSRGQVRRAQGSLL